MHYIAVIAQSFDIMCLPIENAYIAIILQSASSAIESRRHIIRKDSIRKNSKRETIDFSDTQLFAKFHLLNALCSLAVAIPRDLSALVPFTRFYSIRNN